MQSTLGQLSPSQSPLPSSARDLSGEGQPEVVGQTPATRSGVADENERYSTTSASRLRLGDVIFVSLENWDEIWRRNQFVCSELARRFPESRILFVGMPRDVTHILRQRSWREAVTAFVSRGATAPIAESPNLKFIRPVKLLPNSLGVGRRLNQLLFHGHIRRHARKMGIRSPLLWLNAHWAGHLAGTLGESALVYDITDDWALAEPAATAALVRQQDLDLCRRADLVVVCSESLQSTRKPNSRRILLLPNGVNSGHYAGVLGLENNRAGVGVEVGKPADGALNWRAPVFGYTGTLHPGRIDVELVLALAKAFPNGTVALVGPEFFPAQVKARLRAAGNVVLAGAVPYARIPQVMSAFDVCIVPHCQTPFTESLNPIKLWEYLAAGKPMVATNVAGFRDYPTLCRIASGEQEFVAACRGALAEAQALAQGDSAAVEAAESRRVVAAGHSWASRVDVLLGEIEDLQRLKDQSSSAPAWRPPFFARAWRGMIQRGRLMWMKLCHRDVRFGRGCIVRPGLSISVQNNGSVEFGPGCVLDSNLTVECFGRLNIGANVIFGHHCTIGSRDLIQIGDDTLIAEMVSIRDHDHRFDRLDVPVREQGTVSDPVRIGRNVWIGCKATILKGVTIGENAIIGANAVVTRDIPANAIAVGVPARVIRYRETTERVRRREPGSPGEPDLQAARQQSETRESQICP
jgi:acetyltransferase-like isoleucine patch superfamily enzyme/glycosyltransferase involved in cell wall biosynthesis